MLIGNANRFPLALVISATSAWHLFRGLELYRPTLATRFFLAVAVLIATGSLLGSPFSAQAAALVEAGVDAGEGALNVLIAEVLSDDPEPAAPTPSADAKHVVQRGDTLYSIARRAGVSVETLLWANKLSDGQPIKVGQTLTIPAHSGTIHTVAPGETVLAISRASGAPPADIIAVNKLPEDGAIRAGQRILVPSPAASSDVPAVPEAPANDEAIVLTAAQAEAPTSIELGDVSRAQAPAATSAPTRTNMTSAGPKRAPDVGWPVALQAPRIVVSQGFRPGHRGIDIAAPTGTPVKSMAAGVVKSAEWGPSGYGQLLIVDHGNGAEGWYAHLSAYAVAAGDRVEAGQTIGAVGSTGKSTGPHLHLELRLEGVHVDPRLVLP